MIFRGDNIESWLVNSEAVQEVRAECWWIRSLPKLE